ncbi:MAG: hypothetical protein ABJA94_07165 [Rhodoglobus sp.]
MSERHRSPFVPTSFWAALFAPSLIPVAVGVCVLAAIPLDFPKHVLNQLMWGVVGGGLVISYIYYQYRRRTTISAQGTVAAMTLARERDMTYQPYYAVPPLLAAAFGPLNDGVVRGMLSSNTGGEVRIGTFERHSAKDNEGWVQDWGFLAMRLARKLPNILLLAHGRSALPDAPPHADQTLSLEGDFDSHFTLYCPKGSETDALTLFTPDLMALLIDEASGLSVQLVDDAAVFYSPTPIDYTDTALVLRLLRIIDLVGFKTLRAAARYQGDVAPAASRLRRNVPRWPILALWYSGNVLLGVLVGAAALVIRLGPDPFQWAVRAQESWLF